MRGSAFLIACGAIAIGSASPIVEWRDAAKAAAASDRPAPKWTPQHTAALKALIAQVSDHTAPGIGHAASTIGAKLLPLMGTVRSQFPSLFALHGRTLQFDALIQSLGAPPYDANAILGTLKGGSCDGNGVKDQLKALADGAITQSGIQLPGLSGLIDAIWPCFCDELSFGTSINTLVTLAQQPDPDADALTAAVKGALPELFGATTLCGSKCRRAGIAIVDWIVDAATAALTSIPELAAVSLPSPRAMLGGDFGQATVNCFCDGLDWSQLVALVSSPIVTVAEDLVGDIGTADVQTVVDEVSDSIAYVSGIVDFLSSKEGLCATDGCLYFNRALIRYGLAAVDPALASIPPEDQLPGLREAVGKFDADSLMGCFCGETIEFGPVFSGVVDVITPILEDAGDTDLYWSSLFLSIFSPSFLCSSSECKDVTDDILGLFAVLTGSQGPSLSVYKCAATSAGTLVTQSLVVQGDVSSFDKDAFKDKYVAKINSLTAPTGFLINKGMVSVAVSSGSVNVNVSVASSGDVFVDAIKQTMDAIEATPISTLSADLGVSVDVVQSTGLVVQPLETSAYDQKAAQSPSGDDGSSSGAAIAAAAAGGAAVVLALIAYFAFAPKKMQEKPVETMTSVATAAAESKA